MRKKLERKSLERKYLRDLQYAYWPLKILGFNRFDMVDGKIVERSTSSILISLLVMFLIDTCALYMLFTLTYLTDYLYGMEIVIVFEFSVFQTSILLNTSLANRSSCSEFLNTGIDIDNFIGIRNTKFMRNIFTKTYVSMCVFAVAIELILAFVLYYTYHVESSVVVIAGIFFFILYNIYYDLAFFLALYTSLTLRVRYLNVAIMKIANFNISHLPDQFPFNTLFWKKEFDKIVDFHKRADADKFTKAFRMIYNQVRCLEDCYRFTIFACLTYLTVGTFVTVQMFISYTKSSDLEPMRVGAMAGWCGLSWWFQISLCQQTDMFQRQINQTNLICTCIQLRQNYPDEIYKLVGNIISTLEVRDPRVSIYGFFYFDTGLLLKIGATIFVYVAMQLQIAFPRKIDVRATIDNITI